MKHLFRYTVYVFFVTLTACVSMLSGFIYSPVGQTVEASGKTVAVIAGVDNVMNVAVAESMAEALSRNTTFKVLPSKQVEQRLDGYPQKINGPYSSAYLSIDIDFTKTDIRKVKQIMKKLGTEYVYVIWVPTGYSRTASAAGAGTSGEAKQYRAVAQMFQASDAKIVGQGKFDITAVRYLPYAKVSDEDLKKAVSSTTETVSLIIADKTKTAKH